mmetsp:Transcript_2610/g.10079  ORF Transcript_2610/g.10079 Transcript_2610/m.10079 type:complete len:277 (+) Transcript_2610:1287-2117(+)
MNGAGEAAVEVPREVHRGQHVASHGVDRGLVHGALTNELRELHEHAVAAWHLDIQAARGSLHSIMRCTPIAHHETSEARILPEQLLEQLRVLARVGAVHLIVGAHDGAGAGIDGSLERCHVDFVLRAISDFNIHGHAADLLVVVQPMLDGRDDTLALNLPHKGPYQLGSQEGILAGKGLETAASVRDAVDLQVRTQQHIRTLADELLDDRGGITPGSFGAEARGHSQQGRELRARTRQAGVRVDVEALRPVVHGQRLGRRVPTSARWVQEACEATF